MWLWFHEKVDTIYVTGATQRWTRLLMAHWIYLRWSIRTATWMKHHFHHFFLTRHTCPNPAATLTIPSKPPLTANILAIRPARCCVTKSVALSPPACGFNVVSTKVTISFIYNFVYIVNVAAESTRESTLNCRVFMTQSLGLSGYVTRNFRVIKLALPGCWSR